MLAACSYAVYGSLGSLGHLWINQSINHLHPHHHRGTPLSPPKSHQWRHRPSMPSKASNLNTLDPSNHGSQLIRARPRSPKNCHPNPIRDPIRRARLPRPRNAAGARAENVPLHPSLPPLPPTHSAVSLPISPFPHPFLRSQLMRPPRRPAVKSSRRSSPSSRPPRRPCPSRSHPRSWRTWKMGATRTSTRGSLSSWCRRGISIWRARRRRSRALEMCWRGRWRGRCRRWWRRSGGLWMLLEGRGWWGGWGRWGGMERLVARSWVCCCVGVRRECGSLGFFW